MLFENRKYAKQKAIYNLQALRPSLNVVQYWGKISQYKHMEKLHFLKRYMCAQRQTSLFFKLAIPTRGYAHVNIFQKNRFLRIAYFGTLLRKGRRQMNCRKIHPIFSQWTTYRWIQILIIISSCPYPSKTFWSSYHIDTTPIYISRESEINLYEYIPYYIRYSSF